MTSTIIIIFIIAYFILITLFLVNLRGQVTESDKGEKWSVLLKCKAWISQAPSAYYLVLWIVLVALPIYIVTVLVIAAYHNVFFSNTQLQSVIAGVANTLGIGDSWRSISGEGLLYVHSEPDAYYTSFVASAIDNIVFFSLIGLIALFMGIRRPEDDTIHNRISYLLSANKVDLSAREFALERIQDLASYNERVEITLSIEDVDIEKNHYRITTNYRAKIFNMFRKEKFVQEKFCGELTVSKGIDRDGGVLCQFREVRINNENKLPEIESFYVPGKHIAHPVRIEIPPNGSVDCEVQSWLWDSFNELHVTGVSRYTKKLVVKINNASSQKDVLKVRSFPPLAGENGTLRTQKVKMEAGNVSEFVEDDAFEVKNTDTIIYNGPASPLGHVQFQLQVVQPDIVNDE